MAFRKLQMIIMNIFPDYGKMGLHKPMEEMAMVVM